jgi:hypothetical protein
MPLWYLPLIPIYLAVGKKGVMVVLVGTLLYCMAQGDFWRMCEGLRIYKE